MFVKCAGIQNGVIADKYGKRGQQFKGSMPTYSLGFRVEDIPTGTISFAFILDDPDSVPVAGFKWIHWLGANLFKEEIPYNESIKTTIYMF